MLCKGVKVRRGKRPSRGSGQIPWRPAACSLKPAMLKPGARFVEGRGEAISRAWEHGRLLR